MKILVCGGRNFTDNKRLTAVLDALVLVHDVREIVHGGAQGADTLAGLYARTHRLRETVYYADWRTHGRAAGPLRNQRMLDESKPRLVVAFPGGYGTADMVRRARAAGVTVIEPFATGGPR